VHDSVVVVGKGRTCLISDTMISKAGVTCQQTSISVTDNHSRLLIIPSRGYSCDVTQQDNSTQLTVFRIVA
jgi:hypothetical protein